MTPFEAVFQRKSIRAYKNDPVPESVLDKIQNFDGELIPMYPFVKMQTRLFKSEEFGRMLNPLMVKAPYYLAIYAQPLEGYRYNAGNMMEQIALYLHSQGVGTCFVGMMKPPKETADPEGMEFVIMLALGIPKGELNRDAKKASRTPLDKICVYKQEPLKATRQLVEAARLAPSSVNSQPWKFVVYKNRIHIFVSEKKGYSKLQEPWADINMGIMMSHILLAAEEYWIDIAMTKAENLAEKTVPNYQYIGSVMVKP